MIAPIKTVFIKAVKVSTNTRYIASTFKPYASVSNIAVDYIKSKRSENYKSVYVTIDQWNDTEEAYEFMQKVRKGSARINTWWEIQEYKETPIQPITPRIQPDEWRELSMAIDIEREKYRDECENENEWNELSSAIDIECEKYKEEELENENEWNELSTAIDNECLFDDIQPAFDWSEFSRIIDELCRNPRATAHE